MKKDELIKSLENHGFSKKVLSAFKKVKRENFVPDNLKSEAYEDMPLPIGYSQTISQPYTIAFMLDLLQLSENQSVLEIGSGSGYVLALISEIIKDGKIFGVERIKALVDKSKKALKNCKNISIIHKDGSDGLKEYSPYDRILISAASDKLPLHLLDQLKENGIIIAPVRNSIYSIKKSKKTIETKEYPGFVFVPILHGTE